MKKKEQEKEKEQKNELETTAKWTVVSDQARLTDNCIIIRKIGQVLKPSFDVLLVSGNSLPHSALESYF